MTIPATYYALPLFIGSVISAILVVLAWQRRSEPGALAFLISMFALGMWSLAYANEIVAVSAETKILWHKLAYTNIPIVVPFWLLFLLQHEQRSPRFMHFLIPFLLIEPVIFIFLTWTNEHFLLLWTNIELAFDAGLPYLDIERANGFYVHAVYSYLLLLATCGLFLRLLWRRSSLGRLQAVACVTGILAPMVINIFYLAGLNPLHPLDLTPFALVTFGVAASWLTFRFQFWEIWPAARNAIVESMNDGVIVLSKRNIVVDINPTAARLLSLPLGSALGQPIGKIMPNWANLQQLQALLSTVELGPPQSVELMLLDNQTRYVDLAITNLFDRSNRASGRLITLHDVTRRKLVEQALAHERNTLTRRVEERTSDLSEANAQLARAARLKDEFLASMSHELRTPLNTILGLSEALQEQVYGPLSAKQLHALHSIEESGRHLLALINDILDVSKIEAGQLALDIRPVSVESVCQASLSLVRQIALKKQLTVTAQIAPQARLLEADERRLKQMLVNLLSNAVKFTSEGGMIGLEVTADAQTEVIRFAVWDTGIGIDPNSMPRLFQPFVQLDSSFTRHHEGTGLGLVLVYRMTEMHGGSITVDSELGKGSRFTISLPWHAYDAPDALPENNLWRSTDGRSALVINDSQTGAEQTVKLLQELGINGTIYTKSTNVVAHTRTVRPDLILLDLFLPDRFGWDILSELRLDAQTRHVPVIVISMVDVTPPAHLVSDASLGLVHMMYKPFTREELNLALNAVSVPASVNAPRFALATLPALRPLQKPAAAPPTILLVEDNETNISTFSDYLQARGYHVQIARNGHEAMDRLAESTPDLLLLDIQMPGMDGLEVMHLVRCEKQWALLPIVALTALAMPGDRERCLAAGANAYLSKPISLKLLINTIETHLKRSRE